MDLEDNDTQIKGKLFHNIFSPAHTSSLAWVETIGYPTSTMPTVEVRDARSVVSFFQGSMPGTLLVGFEDYPAENGQDNINQEADPDNVWLGLLGTGQGAHDLTATKNEGRLHAPTGISDIDNVKPSLVEPSLQEDSAVRTVGNKIPRLPAGSSTSANPQPKSRNA
ncbi:hypothetical protein M422DRAFT_254922 [Sphaerobolus stellatus SS14]|uniref:Uncharacterized protein n=1 Tax=Sphaerobolus stellatus (strain SS14) TaxID=990650 RepID=A0A0C9VTS1_SPHS4|nr:hypothetical protein M422DRAFT_254922 [Sphaerobolus stellatus SS14]